MSNNTYYPSVNPNSNFMNTMCDEVLLCLLNICLIRLSIDLAVLVIVNKSYTQVFYTLPVLDL